MADAKQREQTKIYVRHILWLLILGIRSGALRSLFVFNPFPNGPPHTLYLQQQPSEYTLCLSCQIHCICFIKSNMCIWLRRTEYVNNFDGVYKMNIYASSVSKYHVPDVPNVGRVRKNKFLFSVNNFLLCLNRLSYVNIKYQRRKKSVREEHRYVSSVGLSAGTSSVR